MGFLRTLAVNDLYVGGSWDIQALEELLPPALIGELSDVRLVFEEGADVLIWKPENNGQFSVKSAFDLVRKRRTPQRELILVWDSAVPAKISIFLWRLLNNLLPFPDILMKFGFSLPSKCPCCDSEDTVQHFFFQCSFAHSVWTQVLDWFGLDHELQGGLFEILHSCWNLLTPSLASRRVSSLLPQAVIWSLWCVRNNFLFNGVTPTSSSTLHQIRTTLTAITARKPIVIAPSDPMLQKNTSLTFKIRTRRITAVRWAAPTPGCWKLDVDGSSLGTPGATGGGMVVRDSAGEILWAAAVTFGTGTNFAAEAQALLYGLEFCVSKGLSNVQVQTDSQTLLGALSNNSLGPWQCWDHLAKIRLILSSPAFQISHMYREGNSVADWLSKLASRLNVTREFDNHSLPFPVRGLARMDQLHLPTLRVRLR